MYVIHSLLFIHTHTHTRTHTHRRRQLGMSFIHTHTHTRTHTRRRRQLGMLFIHLFMYLFMCLCVYYEFICTDLVEVLAKFLVTRAAFLYWYYLFLYSSIYLLCYVCIYRLDVIARYFISYLCCISVLRILIYLFMCFFSYLCLFIPVERPDLTAVTLLVSCAKFRY